MSSSSTTDGRTAFLFLDYQNDVINLFPTSHIKDAFLTASRRLYSAVSKAKDAQDLVVLHTAIEFRSGYPEAQTSLLKEWLESTQVLVEGTAGAQFHHNFEPGDDDIVVKHRRYNPFHSTDLDVLLRSLNVKELYLAGTQTSGVVLSAARSAFDHDYTVKVVRECTFDPNPRLQAALLEELWRTQTVGLDAVLNALVSY
ncbi:Isochorismatase-like protein [Endogone sp. FLAS-F59071]|nr:Isochorismatase-like protein [Endogone sp. FLAS-F59071]|eukprot:RUS12461.1 Isochorismatase-like protein [Endogone sp. FLAS-F59071]